MAASKRFLGLGFTFAATDKGLETKLKAVSEHLTTINEKLKDLESVSKKASVGIKTISDIDISKVSPKTDKKASVKKVAEVKSIVKKSPEKKVAEVGTIAKKTSIKKELPKEFEGLKRHTVMPTGQPVKQAVPPGQEDDMGEVITLFDRTSKNVSKAMGGIAKGVSQAAQAKAEPKKEAPFKTMTLGKAFEAKALNKEMMGIFSDVGKFVKKEVGEKGFAQWANIMNDVFVQFDAQGKLNTDSLKRAKRISDGFIGGAKDVEKKMTSIKVVFGSIKAYFSDVFNAADNFLDSIGIRIRDMIPPQVKAAFNLVKTIISPVLSLPKMLMKSSEKKMQKMTVKNTDKIWRVSEKGNDFLRIMSDEISGKSTNTDGVNENIKKAFGKEGKDEKKGLFGSIFDTLKGALLAIPLLGPLLGKIGSVIGSVFSGISKVGGVLWRGMKFLAEAVWGAFKFIWRFKNLIGETILPLMLIGTALVGFAKGIWDSRQKWMEAISNFGDMIKRAFTGEFWTTLFDNLKGIFTQGSWEVIKEFGKGMLDGLVEIVMSVVDKIKNFDIMGLIKMPFEGLYNSYKDLGSTIPDVLNLAIDKLTKKSPEVKTEDYYRSQIMKNPNKPLGSSVNQMVNSVSANKDLKESLVAMNASSTASNAELLKATLDTNQLLQQQIAFMRSQQGKPVTVKLEAKTSEGTVINALKKQQTNMMSGAGMGM